MQLPPNIRLLRRCALFEDDYTTSTLIRIQIGEPTWKWFQVLVHLELKPVWLRERRVVDRFRSGLQRWQAASFLHLVAVLHVEDEGAPYALLEYAAGHTLATICRASRARGTVLPRPLVDLLTSQLTDALGRLHALGLAHDVQTEHIVVVPQYGIKLLPLACWDDRATVARDRRFAGALCSALRDLAGGDARRPPAERRAETSGLARFVIANYGEVESPWKRR